MNVTEKIENLINSANEVTGEQSETLTDSMQALVDGYGCGGGGAVQDDMIVIDEYFSGSARFLKAITIKGTASIGDYFLSPYLYNGNVPNTHIFSKLTTMTFTDTVVAMSTKAFQNSKLTTINVPWPSGAVSGAPWGATSATINYNYEG